MAVAKNGLFQKPVIVTNKGKVKIILMSVFAVALGCAFFVPKISAFIKDSKHNEEKKAQEVKSAPTDTPIQPQNPAASQLQQWRSKPNVINQGQNANSSSSFANQDLASMGNKDELKLQQELDSKAQASSVDPPTVNEKLNAEHLKESEEDDEDYLNARKKVAKSPYEIQAGSIIPATLNTALNSDLPGFTTAIVKQNVYDTVSGSFLLIPKGTKLFGQYTSAVGYGQQRLLVQWNRLIFSDGSSLSMRKMNGKSGASGVDREGASGFNDVIDNHLGSLLSGAILMSVIGATAQLSQPQTSTGVTPSQNEMVGQTMAGQLGQQLSGTAGKIIDKNLNIPPTIIIRAGYEFNVMVNKDIILEPVSEDN